jgi:hypothetical protein
MADTISIGSFVHLKNKKLGYLDTCELVGREPHFAQFSEAKAMVRTSDQPNRDNGSGTWQIVSANGKADGTPLDNTAQIHLRNCYEAPLGYLSLFGRISDADVGTLIGMAPQYFGGGAYVFTAPSLDGRFGATVGPASFALPLAENPPDHRVVPILAGSLVKLRCYIAPGQEDGVRADNHYLQAFGPLDSLGMLESSWTKSTGTGLVFSSPNESHAPDEDFQLWEISLSEFRG